MSIAVADKPVSTGPVLCLYRVTQNDTVWSLFQFLLRAVSELSDPLANEIEVIVVSDTKSQTAKAYGTTDLQQLPGGISLLPQIGCYSICGSLEEAEEMFRSFSGPIICQCETFEYVSSVVSDPRNVQPLGAENFADISDIRLSDLDISSIATDFLKSWVSNQLSGSAIATVTVHEMAYNPQANRAIGALRKWAEKSGKVVVPIDLRVDGSVADIDEYDVFKICPGAVENIEIRLALYGRSLLNVFIGDERLGAALPPTDGAVLVIGEGEISDMPKRAWLVPSAASDEEIQRAADLAIDQASATYIEGDGVLGEKQMTASIEEFYQIAVRFLQSGGNRVSKAVEILKNILRKDATHADSWALLGIVAHLLRHHEDAVRLFESAISLNPNDAAYFFNLGNAHRAIGNSSDAISAMNAALKLDPTLYEAYDVLAEIYHEDCNYSRALECLDRANELHGLWKPSSGLRAECFSALGDQGRAVECMEDYVSYILDKKENEDAAVAMIWPWCAKLYSSRDAMFLTDYREIGAASNKNPAIAK